MIKIKIVGCTGAFRWYADLIGQDVECVDERGDAYITAMGGVILKGDCVRVFGPAKPGEPFVRYPGWIYIATHWERVGYAPCKADDERWSPLLKRWVSISQIRLKDIGESFSAEFFYRRPLSVASLTAAKPLTQEEEDRQSAEIAWNLIDPNDCPPSIVFKSGFAAGLAFGRKERCSKTPSSSDSGPSSQVW